MILIADSGSTKTDWILLEDGSSRMFKTPGINPYFLNKEEIVAVVKEDSGLAGFADQIKELYFYGAGCTEALHIQQVEEAMQLVFTQSRVEVKTDMVGAARAVLGTREGIAAILGTGTNSCTYNGQDLVYSVPSLGFVLGDEGSGAYIGRYFIKSLLFDKLSPDIRKDFESQFGLSQADIITATLSKPMPNRFLASFCEFIVKYLDDPEVREVVKKSFRDFMNEFIIPYDGYKSKPLGFVGSIAHYFQDPLKEVVSEFGIKEVIILQSPIEALGGYHQVS